jgi:hypothetical protein
MDELRRSFEMIKQHTETVIGMDLVSYFVSGATGSVGSKNLYL